MDRLLHDANTVMQMLAKMVPEGQLKREVSVIFKLNKLFHTHAFEEIMLLIC